jgi:hypothetical protein
MDYLTIYKNLISRKTPYSSPFHKHHIVPRCLGGSDEESNLVKLSVKEHILAHALLVRVHRNSPEKHEKMVLAYNMISRCMEGKPSLVDLELRKLNNVKKRIIKKIVKTCRKHIEEKAFAAKWDKLFQDYSDMYGNFKKFKEKHGYTESRTDLHNMFKRMIPEFTSKGFGTDMDKKLYKRFLELNCSFRDLCFDTGIFHDPNTWKAKFKRIVYER